MQKIRLLMRAALPMAERVDLVDPEMLARVWQARAELQINHHDNRHLSTGASSHLQSFHRPFTAC
jgi:hypothetical protein